MCGQASCGYVDKGTNDNAKSEKRKMHFYLTCRVILILFLVLNPLLYFFQLISFVSEIMNCTNLCDFLQLFGSCIYKARDINKFGNENVFPTRNENEG